MPNTIYKKNYNLFSNVKDKIPTLYHNNVLYELSCCNCQGCYKGQTSKWLKQRITQRKSDYRLGTNTCAVVKHYQRTGHNCDYENLKIFTQENHYKSRLLLEMYHINKNTTNYKSDPSQLTNVYCNVLNLF